LINHQSGLFSERRADQRKNDGEDREIKKEIFMNVMFKKIPFGISIIEGISGKEIPQSDQAPSNPVFSFFLNQATGSVIYSSVSLRDT
jgi:hypothetical protein